jgi:hypothetical protein
MADRKNSTGRAHSAQKWQLSAEHDKKHECQPHFDLSARRIPTNALLVVWSTVSIAPSDQPGMEVSPARDLRNAMIRQLT